MITVIRNAEGKIVEFTTEYRKGGENRNDWKTSESAEAVAAELTEFAKKDFVPVDNGPGHYPRFDVVEVPAVGDEISMSFNGDTYPLGKVAKVGKNFRFITTDCGKRFIRVKQTGGWRHDGTWWLVSGHRYTQNPHF